MLVWFRLPCVLRLNHVSGVELRAENLIAGVGDSSQEMSSVNLIPMFGNTTRHDILISVSIFVPTPPGWGGPPPLAPSHVSSCSLSNEETEGHFTSMVQS